jgi:hypothetical protein
MIILFVTPVIYLWLEWFQEQILDKVPVLRGAHMHQKVNPGHSAPMRRPDPTRTSRGRVREALLCCTRAPARRLKDELSYKSPLYTLEA